MAPKQSVQTLTAGQGQGFAFLECSCLVIYMRIRIIQLHIFSMDKRARRALLLIMSTQHLYSIARRRVTP
jgi:hypothetical protein